MVNPHSKSYYQNSDFKFFWSSCANTYGNLNDFQDLLFQFPWLKKIQENLSGRPVRYKTSHLGKIIFFFVNAYALEVPNPTI